MSRLHKASIYAVVAASFLALAAGGQLGLPALAAFSAAAVASWFIDAAGWTTPEHVPWWNALVGLGLVLSVLHVVVFGAAVVAATVRFLLLLTAVRLVSRHRPRDELQLYALAFLMMASAAAVNNDVTYGFAFAGFVLSGTFSLALFHLKRELRGRNAASLARRIPFDQRYIGVLVGLSLAIFATSIVLFVGFPRVGLGFFETNGREGNHVSGFSDSVELGTHGISRDNPEVALRVEFPDGRPRDVDRLHWRVLTFDTYDGQGWERTLPSPEPGPTAETPLDISHQYGPRMPKGEPRDLPPRLEMYVEPLGSDVLPTLWPTGSVAFGLRSRDAPPGSPRSGDIGLDAYGDLSHSVPSEIGIPYTLHLRRRPDPAALRDVRAEMPPDEARVAPFLQLPRSMERIEALARELTADAESPYERAEMLAQFFQREFTYTTDLPAYGGETPLETFLFETRRGHCEYYATATALMLRTLDIPARLVNGFLGGHWNSVGDYLAVRQQDAHSWVEFYLPEYGWIPMDPTPVGTIQPESSGPLEWFRESYDALRMLWFQSVLEYDLDTQLRLLRNLGDWVQSRRNDRNASASGSEQVEPETDGTPWRSPVYWGGLVLLVAGAALSTRRFDARYEASKIAVHAACWSVAAVGWLALFEGFAGVAAVGGVLVGCGGVALGVATSFFGATTGASRPTELFGRIERAAGAAGVERRTGEPPAAFVERLADDRPDLQHELDRFRHRYLAARFGGRSFDPATRRHLECTAEEICDALSHEPGA